MWTAGKLLFKTLGWGSGNRGSWVRTTPPTPILEVARREPNARGAGAEGDVGQDEKGEAKPHEGADGEPDAEADPRPRGQGGGTARGIEGGGDAGPFLGPTSPPPKPGGEEGRK